MTPEAAIRELVWRFSSEDARARILGAPDLRAWPDGVLTAVQAHGLLREHTPAGRVICPACDDDHVEDVQWFDDDAGGRHAVVRCPTYGRAEVPVPDMRQWILDGGSVARFLAEGLGLTGMLQTIVEDRVWALGVAGLSDQPREVRLIRGLEWTDGDGLRLATGDRAPVLISSGTSVAGADQTIHLGELLQWDGTTTVVDRGPYESWLRRSGTPSAVSAGYAFRREGDGWVLAFGGEPFHLRSLGGLEDIHRLIIRRNEPVPVAEFAGVSLVQDGVPLITEKALKTLRAQIAKGDVMDLQVRKYMRSVTRLDGSPRSGPSPLSKAASLVRNRVDRAISQIRQCNAEMAAHLDASISKGMVLSYRTELDIEWET